MDGGHIGWWSHWMVVILDGGPLDGGVQCWCSMVVVKIGCWPRQKWSRVDKNKCSSPWVDRTTIASGLQDCF